MAKYKVLDSCNNCVFESDAANVKVENGFFVFLDRSGKVVAMYPTGAGPVTPPPALAPPPPPPGGQQSSDPCAISAYHIIRI